MEATVLTELSRWARGDGLEILLWLSGSILAARVIAWVSGHLIDRIDLTSEREDELVRSENAKRRHAITQVVTWVIIVAIYVVATVQIVSAFGVSLNAVIPAATVAGVAVGFGAQRIVQDVLAGFFVLAERQYGYGDLVRISVVGLGAAVVGTVEEVSLRITTVRTPAGEVVITPNGQIAQVTNLSRGWARAVIDVPVPVSADINRVNEALREAGVAAFRDPDLRPLLLDKPAVMGVESIEVDQLKVRVVARTLPGRQFDVGRTLRGMIARELHAAGIQLPTDLTTGAPTDTP